MIIYSFAIYLIKTIIRLYITTPLSKKKQFKSPPKINVKKFKMAARRRDGLGQAGSASNTNDPSMLASRILVQICTLKIIVGLLSKMFV